VKSFIWFEQGEVLMEVDRRQFLKLMGLGSAVFVLGPAGGFNSASADVMGQDDFFFIQLSDSHWGFSGPKINPDSKVTLKKAVAAVNSLELQPDFVVFTGDLTHVTDDDQERRKRHSEVRDIIKDLKVKNVRFMPGEHDAALDQGETFRKFFGETHYAFDHKGVHFIALDNVSDPHSVLGESQLSWMSGHLKKLDKDSRIVVFTHRPLFDLYPEWDWYTRDGGKAIELLKPYSNVTVFYGHIHQEHHDKTDQIRHHAAQGLMFALPAPGSMPKKMPVPWDETSPYKGLGFRRIEMKGEQSENVITEFGVTGEKL
jgi:3',5'-cyclic AMP phosphodiesterase CpdA